MKPEIVVATWNAWAYSDIRGPAYLAFAPVGEVWRAQRSAGYVPHLIPTREEALPLGELTMSMRLASIDLAPGALNWSIPTGLPLGGEAPEWINWTGAVPDLADFEVQGATWRDMGVIKPGSFIVYRQAGEHLNVCAEALKAAGWNASVLVRSEDILAA